MHATKQHLIIYLWSNVGNSWQEMNRSFAHCHQTSSNTDWCQTVACEAIYPYWAVLLLHVCQIRGFPAETPYDYIKWSHSFHEKPCMWMLPKSNWVDMIGHGCFIYLFIHTTLLLESFHLLEWGRNEEGWKAWLKNLHGLWHRLVEIAESKSPLTLLRFCQNLP